MKILYLYNKISIFTLVKGENWINLPQKVKKWINFPPSCPTEFLFFYTPLVVEQIDMQGSFVYIYYNQEGHVCKYDIHKYYNISYEQVIVSEVKTLLHWITVWPFPLQCTWRLNYVNHTETETLNILSKESLVPKT